MPELNVIAAPGLSVPMADNPRRYITDTEPVLVPDDTYYHRRLADGDLVLAEDKASVKTTRAKSAD